ncbi:hypothetical protein FB480_101871 [Agrobacterium vitis]|nr:hypothetical protein FB480_101871 [Agrobacterium vitis]
MARKATIIGSIKDAWGDEWDVREYRPTAHGFDIALGWPADMPRGKAGSGGIRVILTPALKGHLDTYRQNPGKLQLPIGRTSIKRLRTLLGHHWQIDRAGWWDERVDDLSDLTLDQFAKKHGVSTAATSIARSAIFGRAIRPSGWWHQADVAEILQSQLPRVEVADRLGLSVGSIGRLRWLIKQQKNNTPLEIPVDTT